MINLFRNLNPLNLGVLFLIIFFVRAGIFINMPDGVNFGFFEPFARLLIPIETNFIIPAEANLFFSSIIVFVQAIVFNRIINKYNLIGKPTFLPALMFGVGSSLFIPFLVLSQPLICNFLVLWMIDKLLGIYKKDEAKSTMFDVGMIVGFGSLIYFPFLAMILLMFFSLLIFRPFLWREWASIVVGFFTIFFFLAVLYFYNDKLSDFYKIWLPLINRIPLSVKINYHDYLVLVPVIVITLLGAYRFRSNFFKSFVHIRKSFQLLFCLFVIAVLSVYLKQGTKLMHFLLCVTPVSVLAAYYFAYADKRWFYESLFALFLGSVFFFIMF